MTEHAQLTETAKHVFTGRPVIEFLSASQNIDPLLYPGERPDTSYITDGERVHELAVNRDDNDRFEWTMLTDDGRVVEVDDYLSTQGAESMEDRIPVLGFGANLSPGSLARKFSKIGRSDASVVPTVLATLKGHDVVWSGGPGVNGNFIAMLYSGPETPETDVQVGVNFLTREQLLVMHSTELAYDLSSLDVEIAGKKIRAFFYDGQDEIFIKDGKPVAIESINAKNRTIPEASTTEMLENVVSDSEVMGAVINIHPDLTGIDARGYVTYAGGLLRTHGRGAKLALKRLVHENLARLGHSRIQQSDTVLSRRESWANPSTLPTLGDQEHGIFHHEIYRLPSQEVPIDSWSDKVARKRVLGAVSTHYARMHPVLEATNELQNKR